MRHPLTTATIRREFARTHGASNFAAMEEIHRQLVSRGLLEAESFPPADLELSLDEFSTKQGWMIGTSAVIDAAMVQFRID